MADKLCARDYLLLIVHRVVSKMNTQNSHEIMKRKVNVRQ
jgi:hypothetical protein